MNVWWMWLGGGPGLGGKHRANASGEAWFRQEHRKKPEAVVGRASAIAVGG